MCEAEGHDDISSMLISLLMTLIGSATCAMKPRDKGGVVGNELNVYGIVNLKVAGMSPLEMGF